MEIVWTHCAITVDVCVSGCDEFPRTLQVFMESQMFLLPSLPLRVSSYSRRFLHLFATLENSTLRLDCVLSLQVSLYSSNQVDRVP